MFDWYFAYLMMIRGIRASWRYIRRNFEAISKQFTIIGTAAYTSAFIYWIEKGFDFNVLKLAISGIFLVGIAKKLKSHSTNQ